MKIALVSPRYFSPKEVWGEELEVLQLKAVLQRMGHEVFHYDVSNCSALAFKFHDLIINLCNTSENLHLFLRSLLCTYTYHTIFWCVSSPINMQWMEDPNCRWKYSVYLSIGKQHAKDIQDKTGIPTLYLECGTDTKHFKYKKDLREWCPQLYIGNYDSRKKDIILKYFKGVGGWIYGNHWEQLENEFKEFNWMGKHISYKKAPLAYSNAEKVFCLHNQDMIDRGMVQGRVYDVLACGKKKSDIITNADISRVDTSKLDYEFRMKELFNFLQKEFGDDVS
ncbi:MAG: hypothetical protein ACTSUK_05645 [Promethearchaeota archaeon]